MAFVTLIFAGQIGEAHLAGVGLANTLYNIVVTSVSTGYSSVFDTYGPQVCVLLMFKVNINVEILNLKTR